MSVFTDEKYEKIEALLRECGDIMLSAGEVEKNKDNIKQKTSEADLVTVFDVKVQKTVINGLKELFPEAKFLAEEKDNSTENINRGLCFVIDPIDGTTNFIHALGASAISLGAVYDGEPVYGAVLDPYRKELFTAEKGRGAFLNGEKISVSSRHMGKSLVCFGTSPYKKDEFADRAFDTARRMFKVCADVRRSGSAAIDICSVACGRNDGFFELELSPWDFCAGALIVKEAGGIISDMNGKQLSFTSPSSFLCSNKSVYSGLLDCIK